MGRYEAWALELILPLIPAVFGVSQDDQDVGGLVVVSETDDHAKVAAADIEDRDHPAATNGDEVSVGELGADLLNIAPRHMAEDLHERGHGRRRRGMAADELAEALFADDPHGLDHRYQFSVMWTGCPQCFTIHPIGRIGPIGPIGL